MQNWGQILRMGGGMSNSEKQEEDDNEYNVLIDPEYICKSSSLITSSLRRGSEVLQMPNGDVIISETRRVTNQYQWDHTKKQLKKVNVEIE